MVVSAVRGAYCHFAPGIFEKMGVNKKAGVEKQGGVVLNIASYSYASFYIAGKSDSHMLYDQMSGVAEY